MLTGSAREVSEGTGGRAGYLFPARGLALEEGLSPTRAPDRLPPTFHLNSVPADLKKTVR